MIINISSNNYKQYSPEELLQYCLSGIVECNGQDMSEFVEYITEANNHLFTQEQVDKAVDKAIEERESEIISFIQYG